MVSYNDVTKLTYYSEHNKDKELIDLFCSICGSNNIIDILQFIKSERFVEENSSIKLLFDDKELLIFKEIIERGFIGIGCGGGGIPVIRNPNGALTGIEAVIDKDRTSALLANSIGIEQLILLTHVEGAYLNFNTHQSQLIKNISADQMKTYIDEGEFAEGSMKPKVEAAVEFVKKGGKKAIIANLNSLLSAIEGKTGTHISA